MYLRFSADWTANLMMASCIASLLSTPVGLGYGGNALLDARSLLLSLIALPSFLLVFWPWNSRTRAAYFRTSFGLDFEVLSYSRELFACGAAYGNRFERSARELWSQSRVVGGFTQQLLCRF